LGNYKEKLLKLKEEFLEEVFPSRFTCYGCNEEIANDSKYMLCNKCLKNISFILNPCKKCGEDLNDFTNYCYRCKNLKREFDKVVSVANYTSIAKEFVYRLKYGGLKYYAKIIANFLVNKFKEEPNFKNVDIITCVPTTLKRLKDRGFNQAELIAKEFCKQINRPYTKLLLRVKNTPTQTHLTREERIENLKGAFELLVDKSNIKDKNILIIDDIITTGATMNEIALLLKKNNAKHVYGLTFCHA